MRDNDCFRVNLEEKFLPADIGHDADGGKIWQSPLNGYFPKTPVYSGRLRVTHVKNSIDSPFIPDVRK